MILQFFLTILTCTMVLPALIIIWHEIDSAIFFFRNGKSEWNRRQMKTNHIIAAEVAIVTLVIGMIPVFIGGLVFFILSNL